MLPSSDPFIKAFREVLKVQSFHQLGVIGAGNFLKQVTYLHLQPEQVSSGFQSHSGCLFFSINEKGGSYTPTAN
jgi:hypothetical protein